MERSTAYQRPLPALPLARVLIGQHPLSLPRQIFCYHAVLSRPSTPISVRISQVSRAYRIAGHLIFYLSHLARRPLHRRRIAAPRTAASMATMANHDRETTQPTCQNCQTSTTPLWRRDETGAVLCNACGLFLKLHSRPRPISLKTDVIKSRNRVKTVRPELAKQKKVCRCAGAAGERTKD